MANKPHPPILIHGRTTIGINTPIQVDSSGVVATSGGSGGGGGDASAANQTLEIAAINKLNAQILDLDSGAGTANTVGFFIALPASGGPVAGGTTTNPINVALPAATVTTLTPPSNTGYALDATLATIDTDIKANIVLAAGTHVIGHVIADTGSTTAVTGNVAITAASGAIASGAIASGALASGSIASGAIAVGAIAAGATSIADNEDAASADGDRGVKILAIQKATPADTAGTDADYSMLQMAGGRLWVDASGKTLTVGSHAITIASGGVASGAIASGAVASGAVASGAFASGALASGSVAAGAVAAGATSFVKLEDVASADADAGVPAMAVQKATPANTAGTDGDYEFLQISAGRLWCSAKIDTAIPAGSNVIGHVIADSGSTTAVTGNVAITAASGALASGSVASGAIASGAIAVGAIAAGATSIADNEDVASADGDRGVKILGVRKATPANTSGTDGDYEMLQMSAGHLWTYTGGSVATNVAIADNPLNLGAQAVSSENAAVTTARQVQLVADLVGKLIVLPYANPENFVSGAITSAMTGTTTTSLIAAPAAGLRNYITQITVSNSHATVGTDVIIQDGSGGTTLYTIPAAAAYGGATVTFPVPLRQPTTATAIFCANVTTASSTKVSASGYKGV